MPYKDPKALIVVSEEHRDNLHHAGVITMKKRIVQNIVSKLDLFGDVDLSFQKVGLTF